MDDARYGDLDTCADCNAPLADTDTWLCAACITARDDAHREAEAYWASDPLGFGSWRDHQMAHQSAYSLPAAIILIATLLAGMVLYAGWQDVQADDTGALIAPRPINGRIYTWPAIGTPEYSRSCEVYAAWEDGSAYALCSEDHGVYAFDPESYTWRPLEMTR